MNSPAGGALKISLMQPADVLAEPQLMGVWNRLLGVVNPLNRIYASPTWVEHLANTPAVSGLRVAVALDDSADPIGICPLYVHDIPLLYDVASRVIARTVLRAAEVLGSEPMVPDRPGIHQQFFQAVLGGLPECDCIYVDALPTDAPTWRALAERLGSRAFFPYSTGTRPWHWIEMGPSFEQYLATISAKARSAIRRRVRDLRAHGGGSLSLVRVEDESQVAGFLERATAVSAQSWQHRVLGERIAATAAHQDKFRDLARRRVLRSYLLEAGGEPCAFLVGYVLDGVYQYVETGFDERLEHLSPGTVMLYLVFEDLFGHAQPSAFNFGVGDGGYKRRFATRESADVSVFLLRRTFRNRARWASHRAFRVAGVIAKRLMGRKVTK